MRALLKVIRGLIGIGAVGAVVGGGLVAVLAGIVELIDGGTIDFGFVGRGFLAGAGIGLVLTTGFGVILALTSRGRRLEELSFWRATIVSGMLGASLPLIAVAVGGDAIPALAAGAPAIAICGLFGAFLGGGLVALGKEARLRELDAPRTDDELIDE